VKRMLMALGAALALLAPSAAAALEPATPNAGTPNNVGRVVEIRVSGDTAALSRVRMTARELLLRLDVQANVKAIDEPATSSTEPTPLVTAYVDLRSTASPSIDIEDGRTHQSLTQRRLSDVTSLETGVEAVLHVLYLAVESALQVGVERSAPPPPAKKPAPPTPPPKPRPTVQFGFDIGPLLRLSSLGGSRVVPGGGLGLEPRADFGRAQVGLLVSAVLHGTSELDFAGGEADVRPLQVRVAPTFDWLLSSDVAGCFGLGAGVDSLRVSPSRAPDMGGGATPAQSALDPILTGLVGARVPISKRASLAGMASLDLDLAPTSFVARVGPSSLPVLQLPRLRAGFTLALSFTAAGERRFSKARLEP
jgi:hypothetical protein